MKYYHGTNKKHDSDILGPPPKIDVDKGGGEIGQGFYTTNDPWIAKTWAVGKHGESDASVYEISFVGNEIQVMKLSSYLIRTVNELIGNWIGLLRTKRTKTFKFGFDIIDAPFATIEAARQYKFETKKAEKILNSSKITKIY
jgi:hypothetical protein